MKWLVVYLLAYLLPYAKGRKTPEPSPPVPLDIEEINHAQLSHMAYITGGSYYMGSQYFKKGDKIAPAGVMDGAKPRRKVTVKPFYMDKTTVSNLQFAKFVKDTEYISEAEKFGWSFVLDGLVSPDTRAEVDGENGLGRVKDAPHWLGVKGASWGRPLGPDSSFAFFGGYPAVHISYDDAQAYCNHYGLRLPSEKEWEFAARNGYVNKTYPWGNDTYVDNQFNLWQGKFPHQNTIADGFVGVAPVDSYEPNTYGVYNLLGNVWEWVSGGTAEKRILRGGSFLDSPDGKFNHIVAVSTKQVNAGDSGAVNIGFRCARSENVKSKSEKSKTDSTSTDTNEVHIEL
mmetsp:Transcript_23651/g.34684  ORF Transcript_23651/g.34684 Transcript_23651/m.34684 type:complete len:343 (-) Transcript_23651:52-1080(-)